MFIDCLINKEKFKIPFILTYQRYKVVIINQQKIVKTHRQIEQLMEMTEFTREPSIIIVDIEINLFFYFLPILPSYLGKK